MINEDGERTLVLETQNDNDFTVFFKTKYITVNGIEVYDYTWSSESVNGHCRTLSYINLDDILDEDEWVEYGIDQVETIGFTVDVSSEDSITVAESLDVVITV